MKKIIILITMVLITTVSMAKTVKLAEQSISFDGKEVIVEVMRTRLSNGNHRYYIDNNLFEVREVIGTPREVQDLFDSYSKNIINGGYSKVSEDFNGFENSTMYINDNGVVINLYKSSNIFQFVAITEEFSGETNNDYVFGMFENFNQLRNMGY